MRWMLIMMMLAVAAAGCDKAVAPKLAVTAATGSAASAAPSAEQGHELFRAYGCISCHTIPGVAGANGVVGPPLEKMALRGYVAGVITNSRPNLIRWIRNPQGVDPMTAMPNLGVTERDAADMAAYLYTLK